MAAGTPVDATGTPAGARRLFYLARPGNEMKISITLEAEKVVDVPWPNDLPLPERGDNVVLSYAGRVIEFVVDDRLFTIDETSASGSSILIRGHTQPAGAV